MASIGELTATVRADVSGFVGPMQQVVTTTQKTASAVQSITAPTKNLGDMLGQTSTAGKQASFHLSSLRGTLASLASTAAGIPGPLGNLASKLALFGVGGGITVAVLAGIAAIAAAFNTASEAARKQAETVQSLAEAYDEVTGKAHRARVEMARAAVQAANQNTSLGIGRRFTQGGIPFPVIEQVRDMDAVTEANRALLQAEKELADFEAGRATEAKRRLSEATREAQRAQEQFTNALKDAGKIDTEANTAKKTSALTKEAEAWRAVKAEIVATMNAERERANLLPEDLTKAKSDGSVKALFADTTQGARDAAQAMSQAFMAAFSGQQQNLMERITSVLQNAIQEAIQRLIAQKLFESLLRAFSPDKGLVTGSGLSIVGDALGGVFGAPPAMATGSGTLIVPLSSLPPALSPVEVARDVQHQTLWMETARVAEMNGFRLRIR